MKLALVAMLLGGCAALGSPAATYGCQGADVATTLYAVHHGAVEANPIMAPLVAHPAVFIAAKLALAWGLVRWASTEQRAAVNVVTCGVAIHNVAVIQ